jgi:hypothetical protein
MQRGEQLLKSNLLIIPIHLLHMYERRAVFRYAGYPNMGKRLFHRIAIGRILLRHFKEKFFCVFWKPVVEAPLRVAKLLEIVDPGVAVLE